MENKNDFYNEAYDSLEESYESLISAKKIDNRADPKEKTRKAREYYSAINSIRILFDQMMWLIADEKLRINNRYKIEFPIRYTKKSFNGWKNSVSHVYNYNEELFTFLDSIQPYNIMPRLEKDLSDIDTYLGDFSPFTHLLFMLSSIDNSVKHRESIRLNNESSIIHTQIGRAGVEEEYEEYDFFVIVHNDDEKEFILTTPWFPQGSILNAAKNLLNIFESGKFEIRLDKRTAGYGLELK